MPKKKLHPALQENADRLRRGEPIHKGGKKGKGPTRQQRPKIRTKK